MSYTNTSKTNLCPAIVQRVSGEAIEIITQPGFPCPMAQVTARRRSLNIGVYNSMDTDFPRLHQEIGNWISETKNEKYRSFLAFFVDETHSDMSEYHDAFWKCLSELVNCEPSYAELPEGVSDDVTSSEFAFCLHETAFFVVGLTPLSPRLSRKFPWPGFALNPHAQFEELRSEGNMKRLQEISRKRDVAWQGNINPVLDEHGFSSAALQFSGISVDNAMQCPFPKSSKTPSD